MIGGTWTGLDEAIRSVQVLGQDIAESQVIEKALVGLGGELRDDIVRTAPRSRVAPHMADTFVVKVSREAREAGRTAVQVGPTRGGVGFVAGFMEFGTSKLSPRPFIRPAADAFERAVPVRMAAELKAQFSRLVKRLGR